MQLPGVSRAHTCRLVFEKGTSGLTVAMDVPAAMLQSNNCLIDVLLLKAQWLQGRIVHNIFAIASPEFIQGLEHHKGTWVSTLVSFLTTSYWLVTHGSEVTAGDLAQLM